MKRHCENWLIEYLEFTENSEAPEVYHFWAGVATIAGVLQRKVWIDQIYFQWTPNFYIVFVAPPGIATKSTTVRFGSEFLEHIPGIHFGPQSMTWQGLTDAFSDASVLVDINGEGHPMACLTCVVSELGTFLKPDDKDLVDLLTDMWDGQKTVWRRRTRGAGVQEITNPWINVIGATTPSWLRDNVPESMVGGGLTSRVVFVYAEDKRHLVPYPADVVQPDDFKKRERRLLADLHQISDLKGAYTLTDEAKAWGKEWYMEHWTSRPIHMASDRFGGYIARKQTHIHKLAIVLAAAERNELVIEQKDLEFANQMMTGLEEDMIHVFESIGVADSSRHVREILSFVRAFGKISKRDLWRRCINAMSPREFDDALDSAVRAGYIKSVQAPEGVFFIPLQQ